MFKSLSFSTSMFSIQQNQSTMLDTVIQTINEASCSSLLTPLLLNHWLLWHCMLCFTLPDRSSVVKLSLPPSLYPCQDCLGRWLGASANMYLSLNASANSSPISSSPQLCVGKFCINISIPCNRDGLVSLTCFNEQAHIYILSFHTI